MISVIDAIRTEKRSSVQCLERLQTFFDANEDYSSKVKKDIFLLNLFLLDIY